MSISERVDDSRWDDSVEAYVDGELSVEEVSRFENLMDPGGEIDTEVKLARAIQDSFRSLDPIECPDDVSTSILKHAREDWMTIARANAWLAARTFFRPIVRPALATTILLAIVLMAVWSGRKTSEIDPAVAEALNDVKWTLAYVSQVSRQTGTTVRVEALEPLVFEQMKDAVETFIDH